MDEIHNGRVLFRKEGDGEKWLWYASDAGRNFWVVGQTSDKDANNGCGWAYCVEKNLDDPADAATWGVRVGGAFENQPAVTCLHRPAAEE
jgi:hypothetical protein